MRKNKLSGLYQYKAALAARESAMDFALRATAGSGCSSMKARTVENVRRERARTRRLAIGVILLMLASGLITAGMWYLGQDEKPQSGRKTVGLGGGIAFGPSVADETMLGTPIPDERKPVVARSAEDELLEAFPPGAGLTSDLYPESELEIASADPEPFGGIPLSDERDKKPSFTDGGKAPTSFSPQALAPGAVGGGIPGSGFLPGKLPRTGDGVGVVPLAPVPEPQTWLMLCLTPLLIWLAKRRAARRRPACYSTSAA